MSNSSPGTSVATGTSPADRRPYRWRAPKPAWLSHWFQALLNAGRTHPDLALVLLLTIVATAPRVFLQVNAPTFVFTDSPGYVEPAQSFVQGQGLTTRLKRPIGYPLLVAAGLSTNGQLGTVTALQHSIGIATVALTY